MTTAITQKPLATLQKSLRIPALISALLLIAGCSTNVFVKGEYPSPLGHKIPATAGVFLDDKFQDYTFNRESTEIKFGDAQTRLFRTVIDGMFNKTVQLDSYPDDTANVDLVIVPLVEEVQIATPYDNQLKVFEVWIKYNLQVYDGKGNAIADWIMTSYGKTPTLTLTSAAKSLNQASIVALRDAGARMATSFTRVPEIQGWLLEQAIQRNKGASKSTSAAQQENKL